MLGSLPSKLQPFPLPDRLDAELGCLRQFWTRAWPGDDETGFFGDGRRDPAPRRSAIALASSWVMRSSEPVTTTVLPMAGLALAMVSATTSPNRSILSISMPAGTTRGGDTK